MLRSPPSNSPVASDCDLPKITLSVEALSAAKRHKRRKPTPEELSRFRIGIKELLESFSLTQNSRMDALEKLTSDLKVEGSSYNQGIGTSINFVSDQIKNVESRISLLEESRKEMSSELKNLIARCEVLQRNSTKTCNGIRNAPKAITENNTHLEEDELSALANVDSNLVTTPTSRKQIQAGRTKFTNDNETSQEDNVKRNAEKEMKTYLSPKARKLAVGNEISDNSDGNPQGQSEFINIKDELFEIEENDIKQKLDKDLKVIKPEENSASTMHFDVKLKTEPVNPSNVDQVSIKEVVDETTIEDIKDFNYSLLIENSNMPNASSNYENKVPQQDPNLFAVPVIRYSPAFCKNRLDIKSEV